MILLAPGFVQPVAAQQTSPPVNMQVSTAFDGNFKYGEWVPIIIELENDGPDLEAEIRASVTGSGGTMTFTTPIPLPTVSHKRITLYVLPNNYSRELEVHLVSGDQLLATQKVSLQPHPNLAYLVGLIAPERGSLALIDAIELPGVTREKVLVDVTLNELPERFEGLRSFNCLVFNGVDTSNLTPGQVTALEAWVNQGGRLVIGGGAGGLQALSGLPISLVPFTPDGTIELTQLNALVSYTNSQKVIQVPGPFLATIGKTGGGSILVRQGSTPLLVEWSVGSGTVDFVTLDLNASPFDAWSGTIAFWETLLSPGAAYPDWMPYDVSARQQLASQMPYALSNLPMLDLPSTKGLALLLGFYILLIGPVNYLVLRWKKRLHWAWVTIPLVTILFSTGAFGLGYAMHGTDIFINKIAILDLQPDGKAYTTSYVGVFSPGRGAYEIEVETDGLVSPMGPYYDPWNSFAPGPGINNLQEMILVQSNPSYVRGLNIDQWSMQSFMVEGNRMDFGQVTYILRIEGNTLNGEVHNQGKYNIHDAIIILGKRIIKIGDISAGEIATVDIELVEQTNPIYGPSLSYRIFEAELSQGGPNGPPRQVEVKRSIIENVFERLPPFKQVAGTTPGSGASLTQTPTLIGWLDEAPPGIRIAGGLPAQQTTALLMLPITYELPVEGLVQLPTGMISGLLVKTPQEGGSCGEPGATAVYLYRGEALFEYYIPPDLRKIQVENLKLSLWLDSGPFVAPVLEIYDWKNDQWMKLKGVEQGVNVVPEAYNLVRSDGTIQVRLSAENTTGGCYYLSMGLEGYPK